MDSEVETLYHLPIGSHIESNGLVLTLTEEGWRAEVQHSMMRRCKGWDYCKPWIYLVTIGCQHHEVVPKPEIPQESVPEGWSYPQWLLDAYRHSGRPHLFGELTGDTEQEAAIALSPFGQAVQHAIHAITSHYPQVRIIESVVMPNHIHMVLRVKDRLPEKTPLGIVLNKFKSWVNRDFKAICLGLPETTRMDLSYQVAGRSKEDCKKGAGAVPGTATRAEVLSSQSATERTGQGHGSKNPKIGLVFETGFHDRILFREGQLQRMIEYCLDNPRRLWLVKHNAHYFHTLSGLKLTMPLLTESGTKGQQRWQGPLTGLLAPIEYTLLQGAGTSQQSAGTSTLAGDSRQSTGGLPLTSDYPQRTMTQTVTVNAIGNRNLLKAPERLQIQCSRSMSEAEIATRTAEVLEACKHGVVPISPCISPGEKAIARAVMTGGYNLIALFPQGIPEDTTYKPYKEFFDACANGQLLLLSPWKFEEGVKHIARWQCLFLNDLAMQLMAGVDAQEQTIKAENDNR